MGITHYSTKTNKELFDEINQINQITTNELFYNRTGFFIHFHFGGCQILWRRIKAVLYKKVAGDSYGYVDFPERDVIIEFKYLSLSTAKFYKFYNILSECLPIFYENNVRSRSFTPKIKDFDLCPICLENQPNMLLECNHLFCTKCIKTWLFKRQKNCPMCRMEFDDIHSENEMDGFSNKEYIIIAKSELLNLESVDEMDSKFVAAIRDIL